MSGIILSVQNGFVRTARTLKDKRGRTQQGAFWGGGRQMRRRASRPSAFAVAHVDYYRGTLAGNGPRAPSLWDGAL